jgi:cellulose synthase/poly-beta-1,6-N-acetylglucosamine synthase-like glycosyltransferase
MLEITFWLSIIVIAYTYFGYPLTVAVLSVFLSRPVKKGEITPSVSLLISAYNEEEAIERKLRNCLELDYPKGKLEIIVGSDGSTDRTNEVINNYTSEGIKFYRWGRCRGKASVLNDLVPRAKGEIIVFTDARQALGNSAIRELVSNFADKNIGCVSGELILAGEKKSLIGEGLGLYWKYEKFLRRKESRIGSMIGATGAIYAIRKKLYVPVPVDTLLDDVFIPIKIVEQGYRAIFESRAKAYGRVSQKTKEEFVRKVRTLAGNWQIFARLKNMLNPFKSKIALQLFSHKFLRVMIPYFLAAAFISNAFLLNISFYKIAFVLQIAFYLFATIGSLLLKHKIRLFNIPYTFCLLNITAVKGLYSFVGNHQKVTWKKIKC